MVRTMAKHKQAAAIRSLASISHHEICIPIKSYNGVAEARFAVTFLSPVDILVVLQRVSGLPSQRPQRASEALMLDSEEEDVLGKLTRVPQSCCRRSRHRICKYRPA